MTDFPDIMLDLETLGVGRDAAIVAIGAVRFDLRRGKVGGDYYARVDLAKSRSPGNVEYGTVEWWLKQSPEAIAKTFHDADPPKVALEVALATFVLWAQPFKMPVKMPALWSNGPNFDEVLLRDAWSRTQAGPFPFAYWKSRCYRTLKDLAEAAGVALATKRAGTHHCAVDDARFQAQVACESWKGLRAQAVGKP